ncbi:hypothetical protein BO85DRAFT_274692 [Aspergillus piperis CBS 112811]|uniref:Uncharacterized protein n=1 Tax=Aspergillus piperis CBS 112811 TaxID=1448313 RepID=A0A8G1VNB8_9EURO|nr:hypothetical protein BO85DRAFT_274692 [Aspergillus piperis CBS 112811]RAH58417.1 hypothetical protein BO85DRAFT_274692 [Aspergillus piperis CBS 112811]
MCLWDLRYYFLLRGGIMSIVVYRGFCDTTLSTPNSPRWIPLLRQPGYATVGLVPLGGCERVRGVGEEVVLKNWGIL